MAYDDTNCPCGEQKERQTLICKHCESAFRNTIEYKGYANERINTRMRRGCAIRLLSMSRQRKSSKGGRP